MGASSGMPQREIPAVQDPAYSPADIAALVADELIRVEDLFRRSVASPVRIVDEIGSFVADGGGKRVRPMLHLLCAKLGAKLKVADMAARYVDLR